MADSTASKRCAPRRRLRTAMVEPLEARRLLSIYSADMSTNPGWTLDNASGAGWNYGTPVGAGGDPSAGHTGRYVVGTILASPGTYSNNVSSTSYATTGAFDCSNYTGVTLSFWRYLGILSGDTARTGVSSNGSTWTNLFTSSTTIDDGAWTLETYDISSVADLHSTVYVRWGLGPTNASGVSYGWNLDDVTINGTLHTPPSVTSIARAGPSPTNASSVQYTVTFSTAVTGVDVTDFALSSAEGASGSITSVTGSGSSYTVTVSSVAGDGSLRLNLVDDDSIHDSIGLVLGGAGTGNGSFNGQTYIVDRVAPTVSSINLASQTRDVATYNVTFSEPVSGVDTGDFSLAFSGTAGGGVSGVSGSGSTYQVSVATSVGDGTVGLNLVDNDSITDLVGNPLGGSGAGNGNLTGGIAVVDHTAPTITTSTLTTVGLVVSRTLNVDIRFSEAVAFVDATDLVLSGQAATSATVGAPSDLGGNTWRFPIAGLVSGALNVSLAPDTGDIQDRIGNSLAPASWSCPVNVGSTLAYSYLDDSGWDPSQINVIHPDGSGLRKLTLYYSDTGPAFSFDGSRIAYSELGDLRTMNAEGSAQSTIASTWRCRYDDPVYSPDGSKIAVSYINSSNNSFLSSILLLNADGTGTGQYVTNDPPSATYSNIHPSFTPDGSKIAFASGRDGNLEIYLANTNGTNLVRLTNNAADDWDPSFSRDGSRIVFTSERDGNREIYVMNADGTNPVRLTDNAASDSQPCFSPDGSQIAFTSTRDGGQGQIYIMNADGSNPMRVTGLTGSSSSPAWGVDAAAPSVASISGVGASPTNATSLQWTVTFSESVTGVDPSDFALTKTGTADGTIASVTGSGSSYTVTVNSVAGNGTLKLNLVDDDSVQDLGANKLGGSGAGNGNSADPTGVSVDHTAPTVYLLSTTGITKLTNATSLKFYLTFTKTVTGVDTTDFALVRGGTANGSVTSITDLGYGTYYVNVSAVVGDGTLGLNLVDNDSIIDAAGNPLGGAGSGNGNFTGEAFTLDHTAPTTGPTIINAGAVQRSMVNQVSVGFSEAMTLSAGAIKVLKRDGSAIADVSVALTNPSGDGMNYLLTFSGLAVTAGSLPDGMYKLVVSSASAADKAGNHLGANSTVRFHRLFGDADGDRDVDRTDLTAFRAALNKPAAYVTWFDYSGDSLIDSADHAQLRARMLRRLL